MPATVSSSADVLIVGAGPVGATLALELARHHTPSIVIERSEAASPHPKMDFLNGRTMELLRRLDVVDEVRRLGVPPDHRFNFRWMEDLDTPPVATWDYPSVDGVRARYAGVEDGSAPLEPYQRLPGSVFERILRDRVARQPLVDLREGWRFEDLDQGSEHVAVRIVRERTGEERVVRARYVVGCDGAGSAVRAGLGIGLDALAPPTRHCDVYFCSRDPLLTRHGGVFFLTILANGTTLVSRNGRDTWTATFQLPDEREPGDPAAVAEARLGIRIRREDVRNVAIWTGRLAVSDAYRRGAVFLAGDSAHQFYPTGGHGANTGIGDAVDLGWKLAARLRGWGGERLLDSYEAERRPVALFSRAMCANLLDVWRRFPQMAAEDIPPALVAGYLEAQSYQVDNIGIHFGSRYERSPVVGHEAGPAPRWDWHAITPTTWPGSRAPSLTLPDGSALFDRLGTGLTLVDFTDGAGRALAERARERGVPLTHLPVRAAGIREVWQRDLVLVRPDQHVAWRGQSIGPDCDAVLDLVTGR